MIIFGQQIVEWVAQRTGEFGNYGAATGIGVARNGHIIAGVVFNEWNGVNVNQHVAASELNWMSRQLLWYCFDYPFNQLKVKRITAFMGQGNTAAIRLNTHLGFQYETRLKDAHPSGDVIIQVMRREDCRWLNLERPKNEQRMAA